MKNQLNPKWLIVSTVIPTLLLIYILKGAYFLIDSELDAESLSAWKVFSLIFGSITLANFFCIAVFNIYKSKIPVIYPIIFIPFYLLFAFYYFENINHLMPWSLPRWMLTENLEFYVVSLLSPTILILIYILTLGVTNFEKIKFPYLNLFYAALVPLSIYIFIKVFYSTDLNIGEEFGFIGFCLLFIIFLFFIIRLILILVNRENAILKNYSLVFNLILGIIFPILGLLVNQGFSLDIDYEDDKIGIFGDFSSYWFFILAFINGILFCLGEIQIGIKKTVVYFFRCVLFVYITYFFIVFLPFLPLSIIFIILAGLGFLTLTPLFLFFLQGKLLLADFNQLRQVMPKFKLLSITIIGFLVIPTSIFISYKIDKYKLDKVLNYVYSPDYSIEKANIKRTFAIKQINKIKRYKNEATNEGFFTYTPYLSNIYKSIVYDNLMLSDNKIGFMEDLFKGETYYELKNKKTSLNIDNDVLVDNIQTKTIFDEKENAYVSEINIDLKNKTTSQTEFAAEIKIPDGAFIIDYFLKVGDSLKHGILAEKKTALWVYNQIVNERRDPGILFYKDKNTLELRVFPFAALQKRNTGFTIIHRDAIKILLGDKQIDLNCPQRNLKEPEKISNNLYFPAQLTNDLPIIERQAYFHFLLDFSTKQKKNPAKYVQLIKETMAQNQITNNYDVSVLNWKMTTLNKNNWENEILDQNYEGGLNLDLGLEKTLFNHLKHSSYCPKIILVSDKKMDKSIKRYTEFDFMLPDEQNFYNITFKDSLEVISFNSDTSYAISGFKLPIEKCKIYKEDKNAEPVYLPIKNGNYLVPTQFIQTQNNKIESKNKWENGVLISNNFIIERLYPNVTTNWLNSLKLSFKSHILSSNTTFMVVETKMQEEFLAIKQEEVMNGNKNLDLGEEIEGMDEPQIWIYGILMLVLLFIKRKKFAFDGF